MSVRISRAILRQILAEAEAAPDREICGLLLGHGTVVLEHRPTDNVAADSARHFELDPAVLLAAHRQARRGGLAPIGHYHSHPSGSTTPSHIDAEMAAPDGTLWMIVAHGNYACWRAGTVGLHGRFRREAVEIVDGEGKDMLASADCGGQ